MKFLAGYSNSVYVNYINIAFNTFHIANIGHFTLGGGGGVVCLFYHNKFQHTTNEAIAKCVYDALN